jgi:hypothetical protein
LTIAAQAHGITRIDHVVLSDDASRAFAVQGDLNGLLKRYTSVNVGEAVGTSLAQSSNQWLHHAQTLTPTQAPGLGPVPMVHGAPDAGLPMR